MRFRVSVNADALPEGLRGQLGGLAPSLINTLRMFIRGWDASRVDFKNGFIMGGDRYYYFVKVDSSMLVNATTNNPKWVAETVEAVVNTVKSSKLPVEIGVGFKAGRGVISIEIVLNPRQEGGS
jgi:hypothetical protein